MASAVALFEAMSFSSRNLLMVIELANIEMPSPDVMSILVPPVMLPFAKVLLRVNPPVTSVINGPIIGTPCTVSNPNNLPSRAALRGRSIVKGAPLFGVGSTFCNRIPRSIKFSF